jgi:hypothetical protein
MKKKDIPMWAKLGHSKPISRRDFLAAGLIPFAAEVFMPGWTRLLLPETARAEGAICPSYSSSMIPLISVNLAGGSAMGGNFVPHNSALEPLSSYSKLGLGDNQLPITREFGNVPFAGSTAPDQPLISRFLAGVRDKAPTALGNTAFIAVCLQSRDDSAENRLDISGLAQAAGLAGRIMPNVGVSSTASGVNQMPARLSPTRPLVVGSFGDMKAALSYTGALSTQLNVNQRLELNKLVNKLSGGQHRKLATMEGSDQIKNMLECIGVKNESVLAEGVGSIDPRLIPEVAPIWGITPAIAATATAPAVAATAENNAQMIQASITYNALMGNSGSANMQLGGYDYHDNTRTTGDARDFTAGQLIGRILETAAVLKKPLFLYVTTDGAVSSADSVTRNSPWTSDRGPASVNYVLIYNPDTRIETSSFQIGHFTNGQVADSSFPTGANPELAAVAVFANYLKLNNKLDLLNPILGSRTVDAEFLKKVIKVG